MPTYLLLTLVSLLTTAFVLYEYQRPVEEAVDSLMGSVEAIRVSTQSQQLVGAMNLFRTSHGRWPASLQELVDTDYLARIPATSGAASSNLQRAWALVAVEDPVLVSGPLASVQGCAQFNLSALGDNGVLKQAVTQDTEQCLQDASGQFRVVVALAGVHNLAQAATQQGWAVLESRPQEPAASRWALAPHKATDLSSLWVNPVSQDGHQCVNLNGTTLTVTGALASNTASPLVVSVWGPQPASFLTLARVTFDGVEVPLSAVHAEADPQWPRTVLTLQGAPALAHGITATPVALELHTATGTTASCYFTVS